jgi:NADH-quinone oxidoreductase subunit E
VSFFRDLCGGFRYLKVSRLKIFHTPVLYGGACAIVPVLRGQVDMLTEEEKKEIEEEIRKSERKRAAAVEVLKIVQKHRGWISDELYDLAEVLDMTPAEIDSLATFYSLVFRKPVGKHVILICDSVSCWLVDYEKILGRLTARLGIGLGETTANGQFTLLPVACLGACDQAPAMMIDEVFYGDLTIEKIDQLLEKYGWEE